MPVNTEGPQLLRWSRKIVRCRDAYEGTDAIKEAGVRYLPMLPSQMGTANVTSAAADAGYRDYKRRALFVNATSRAVIGLAGLVMQKRAQVAMPTGTEDHDGNITLAGEDLQQFAAQTLIEDLISGGYGILIDYPSDAESQESAGAARPYWSLFRRECIVSWRTKRIAGVETLTQVVLKSTYDLQDPDDDFVCVPVPEYLQLFLDENGAYTQQTWRQPLDDKGKPTGDFEPYEDPVVPRRGDTLLPFIPFVMPDQKKPPLVDMVDINLAHYMMSADYKHGLHMVALPTPYVVGFVPNKGDEKKPVPIGPKVVLKLKDGGSASMMEYSGAGLKSLRDDLNDMLEQMALIGTRLISDSSVQQTATEIIARSSGESSSLRSEVGFVEADLTRALKIHGWWAGIANTPDEVDVEFVLNRDFLRIDMDPALLQSLTTALLAGKISYKTWWAKLVEGGIGRRGVTAEEEVTEIGRDETNPVLLGLE